MIYKEFVILFIGDVVGKPGRRAIKEILPRLVSFYRINFVVCNVENASSGKGIDKRSYKELIGYGIDVMTLGNHTYQKADIRDILNKERNIIRPANYSDISPGRGFGIFERNNIRIAVINLIGRLFMKPVDCPFRRFDDIYDKIKEKIDLVVVDFHAEATSEKQAFGWYVMSRANVIVGTHTHVQTADGRILNKKTAYITDLGMTGALDSVIGFKVDKAIKRFLVEDKIHDEVAKENIHLQGFLVKFMFDIKNTSHYITHILRIDEVL